MPDTLTTLTTALADRYKIERELGAGGMATVYLAEDLKHHRKVALKVLRPELAASLGSERFAREIEVAARLTHPHILGLLDSGDTAGFFYYVMPYVEGETLRDRIARAGELPVHEAVRLLGEIADALAVAHKAGVVHRDIKPENILLSGRHALVMDFGVAKAVTEASGRQQLTTAGIALGTPAYMAPEQATADPQLDGRVDIYALGVVGYEMLSGFPPFHGLNPQQTLAAQVTQAPVALGQRRPGLSPALESVVMRCLAKRPADRFQSADELVATLEPLSTPSGGMTPTSTAGISAVRPAVSPVRLPPWAMIAIGIGIVAGGGYGTLRAIRGGAGGAAEAQSVAVLPFENVGADNANAPFTDGIQSEILTDLTRLAALKVTSRTSVLEYRNTTKPMKQIGTELGVRSLLQGQVQRAGNQVHVTVQLVDAPSDRQIWAESYDREVTTQNVFTIQSDIARKVAEALRASFSPTEVATAERPPTDNLEALDWYHRGKELFAARGGALMDTANAHAFERAIALDSGFAEAWAGLAATRSWLVRQGKTTDTLPARTALDRAALLAPASAETEIAQAYYAYYARGDFEAALAHFRAVAAKRPNDVDAIAGIGAIARRRGHWSEALDAEQKVILLDPRNIGAVSELGFTYVATGQFARAEEMFRRVRTANPTQEGGNAWLFIVLVSCRGDTAAGRSLLAGLSPSVGPAAREYMTAQLERLARHFERSSEAWGRVPNELATDRSGWLIEQALNDLAAGTRDRSRLRADSAAQIARSSLAEVSGADPFGNRADFHTILGLAAAIGGREAEAVREGERAVALNPATRDVMEASRSVAGLIMIHLILGHRDEAIRMITEAAHEPVATTGLVVHTITAATIRLDPLFDGIRNDPRMLALLKDDAAWVVQ